MPSCFMHPFSSAKGSRVLSGDGVAVIKQAEREMLAAALGGAMGAGLGLAVGLNAVTATGFSIVACGGAILLRHAWQQRLEARQSAAAAAREEGGEPVPAIVADLLAAVPLGILLLDGAGRVLHCNPAADELIERRVTGMLAAAALRAPALTEAIGAALAEGRRSDFEVTLLRSKERLTHASVLPMGDGGRRPGRPGVIVLLEDRTRAEKAESLRRDFVANASHELRTPLASISGFIETLQGHARNDPEASERFLKIMAAQAERMRRLIDDLLSLNRIEINEHVQPREKVDLAGAVRETVAALGPVAEAAGTSIEVDLPDAPVPVRGSPDELAQLFANLIDNAVKYAGDAGPIRVGMQSADVRHPGMVGITVADNGPGIPREHLPRLTERFYRVSNERSRERGGTGLGLAIAKHIVNRHRGDLTVTSTLGQGTCFTVWLPSLAATPSSGVIARAAS